METRVKSKIRIVNASSGLLIVLLLTISSCGYHPGSLTQEQSSVVKEEVQQMADSIARNVSEMGPVAWLRWFENAPDFFMASEGKLVFSTFDSATSFINKTLVKTISKIELHWGNIRIDPYTEKLASIAAVFHEDMTDSAGNKLRIDGYFTGVAYKSSQGWRLRNAHWSTYKPNKPVQQ
jgi:hypothetical protein